MSEKPMSLCGAFLMAAAEQSVNKEPVRAQGKALEMGICPSPQSVCVDCGFNLAKTCPTWWPPSRPLDRDFTAEEMVEIKTLALDALAIGYHSIRAAAREMFEDYYIEYMGSADDWMDELQQRADRLVEEKGRELIPAKKEE